MEQVSVKSAIALKLTAPWYGIPRDMILRNPTFNEAVISTGLDFRAPIGAKFVEGTAYSALDQSIEQLTNRNVFMAGPTTTMHESLCILAAMGTGRERILVDSYGG